MTAVRDSLIAITELLAPGIPDVAQRVLAAHDDPAMFLRDNASRLDERGIDEPTDDLAWIALVDALTDHVLLAEADWREQPEEVARQLRRLRSSPAAAGWHWVDDSNLELDTEGFLLVAGDRLRESGTALALLDIDSDCYPLVLLPTGRVSELTALATAAGFVATILGSTAE